MGNGEAGEKTSATRFHWGSATKELDRRGGLSASEEVVSIPGLPKRRKESESWVKKPEDISCALHEMDLQEEAISEWAKQNNRFIPLKDLLNLAEEAATSSKGFEHSVYFKGGWVIKTTQKQMYGLPYKTPSQYLDQLNDFNSIAAPDLQRRFLGVSEDERGVSVIVTAQRFQKGRPPKDENEIVRLMEKEGWSTVSSKYSYRNKEGVELHDVHEGNMIVDLNGKPQLFDVWVILPQD